MPRKYKWDKKYLYWGITMFLVILASIVVFWIFNEWDRLKGLVSIILKALSPIIYGLFFAYLFNKFMSLCEEKFLLRLGTHFFPDKPKRAKQFSRVTGILLTVLFAFVVVGGVLALMLPQLYSSIEHIALNIPTYYKEVVAWVSKFFEDNPELNTAVTNLVGNLSETFADWIQNSLLPQAQQIITNITSGVIGIVKVIFNILVGVIVSVYILYHKEIFGAQCKKIIYGVFKPHRANKILRAVDFTDNTCGGFITGKIIDSLIVGVICYPVLLILDIPFAALVSVIVCVTNIIPFFGPFIGAVPSAILILLEAPVKCVVFVIFVVILQQLDGNFIGPKVLGNSLGISGFWIMFAILFFGGLFGFWGMLFGVPLFAMIYAFVRHHNVKHLKEKELPSDTSVYLSIDFIDPETNTPVYKTATLPDNKKVSGKSKKSRKKSGQSQGDSDDKKDN